MYTGCAGSLVLRAASQVDGEEFHTWSALPPKMKIELCPCQLAQLLLAANQSNGRIHGSEKPMCVVSNHGLRRKSRSTFSFWSIHPLRSQPGRPANHHPASPIAYEHSITPIWSLLRGMALIPQLPMRRISSLVCAKCSGTASDLSVIARVQSGSAFAGHFGVRRRWHHAVVPRIQRLAQRRARGAARRWESTAASAEKLKLSELIDRSVDPRSQPILQQDDLFHSFTFSPIPEMRRRAAYMKQHAYCPHPEHQTSRAPEMGFRPKAYLGIGTTAPRHVEFECPDCGIPVYCCEEHWQDDYEAHLDICDALRQINEDDHDLRSGRYFPEFDTAPDQMEESHVNMTNWDTFLYTRDFAAINSDRGMRQATRLLTYPITIASFLHKLSPYNIRPGGRLTPEGLKSLGGMYLTSFMSKDADSS
jgi:hypothetical protein